MRCIIDGHCDTLSKALDTNKNLNNSQFCFNIHYNQSGREC